MASLTMRSLLVSPRWPLAFNRFMWYLTHMIIKLVGKVAISTSSTGHIRAAFFNDLYFLIDLLIIIIVVKLLKDLFFER